MKLDIQMFADGKVVIETDLDSGGFSKGLDKIKNIAEKGFKAVAVSVGVVSTALAGLVAKSVNMAGELEQQIGGTEAVFGEFAKTVQDKAAKSFQLMGTSANDFMATANKMGALMQGSGIDIETSMELSTAAMQRAADVASIMGIDINSAMESIAGAAKGNFTMMDNLGVAMNATTIEAYALSKGIKTSYNEMDNATKIGLAMEMFLEKTAYAEGNYAKENETFAGSLNTLKASLSNFLSGAGGIEDVANAVVNFGGILAKSIGEMAPTVINGIINLVNTIIPQLPPLIMKLLPIIIDGGKTIVEQLITTIVSMLPEILQTGIDIILELVNGLSESLPTLIPVMVEAILVMVETLIDNIDVIIDAAILLIGALTDGLLNALPILIDKVPTIIIKLVEKLTNPEMIGKIIYAAAYLIGQLAVGIIKAIPQLVSKIPEVVSAIFQAFINGFTMMKDAGKHLIEGLWQGIKDKWNALKGSVENLGQGIVNKFKSVFGIKSPSRVFRDQIGKQLSAGIGVGFEDELDNVYRDMQKAIDYETSKLSANVETNGTYQMAMAGSPVFNLLDNTSNSTQLVVNGKVLAEVVNEENRLREVSAQ